MDSFYDITRIYSTDYIAKEKSILYKPSENKHYHIDFCYKIYFRTNLSQHIAEHKMTEIHIYFLQLCNADFFVGLISI